jgi:hypothetical protein
VAAELLHRLARDTPVRRAVLEGQAGRLARWRARDVRAEVREALAPVLGDLAPGRHPEGPRRTWPG